MQVELITTLPGAGLIRDARAVYAAAFAQAPYCETAEQAAGFDERVHRYAAQRDGFRLTVARGIAGRRSVQHGRRGRYAE